MIRKPTGDLRRESRVVADLRRAVTTTVAVSRAGSSYLRGMVCWGFAGLWGFAALAGGLSGSLPTFVGVGAMAAFMAWNGSRLFANASK